MTLILGNQEADRSALDLHQHQQSGNSQEGVQRLKETSQMGSFEFPSKAIPQAETSPVQTPTCSEDRTTVQARLKLPSAQICSGGLIYLIQPPLSIIIKYSLTHSLIRSILLFKQRPISPSENRLPLPNNHHNSCYDSKRNQNAHDYQKCIRPFAIVTTTTEVLMTAT